MCRSIFKMIIWPRIITASILLASSIIGINATNAGSIPDDNVCTEAGLYCNAEALCKTYLYHMECDTSYPKASQKACEKVLANFNEVSDKPMPSIDCPPEFFNALAQWSGYRSLVHTECSECDPLEEISCDIPKCFSDTYPIVIEDNWNQGGPDACWKTEGLDPWQLIIDESNLIVRAHYYEIYPQTNLVQLVYQETVDCATAIRCAEHTYELINTDIFYETWCRVCE